MNLHAMKRHAVPLHVEVATLLRNEIFASTFPPGSQLPSLGALTEKMGVARMTIRQAMDALEEEGLIERHSGRGTFVKQIEFPKQQTMNMKAELSQLRSMVASLEVATTVEITQLEKADENDISYLCMKRIHARDGKPACCVDLRLDNFIYEKAPERFANEIVVSVLYDLGITISSARQNVTISYADFEIAQELYLKVNSPVFRVFREFFDPNGRMIYSAIIIYPGEKLEFEIEFAVDVSE